MKVLLAFQCRCISGGEEMRKQNIANRFWKHQFQKLNLHDVKGGGLGVQVGQLVHLSTKEREMQVHCIIILSKHEL